MSNVLFFQLAAKPVGRKNTCTRTIPKFGLKIQNFVTSSFLKLSRVTTPQPQNNVGWSVGISPFTVRQSVDVVSKLVAVSPVDKKVLPTDYPFIDRQSDGENSQTDSVLLFMPTDHVMLYICLPIDSPTGILKLIKKIKSNVAESLHIKYVFD